MNSGESTINEIIITEQLFQRAPRQPNLEAENQILRSLGKQLTKPLQVILKHFVEIAKELCQAGTASITLIEPKEKACRWVAISGAYQQFEGYTTPLNSPCSISLEQKSPQLYAYPERYFTYLQDLTPAPVEMLVVPLIQEEQAIGTIWVVAHDQQRHFDCEDARVLISLADFLAAALSSLQTEQKLRESRVEQERILQKFETTLSTISDYVFNFDRDGRITYANQVLLDLWGITATEAIGKTLAQLNYPPAVEQHLMKNLRRVFETGTTIKDETYYTPPTGVNGYFEYILCPAFAADGTVEFVAGSARNIIEHKQTEAALRRSEEQSRNILESITDSFFAIDENWQFTYINQSAETLLDRTSGDLIGKNLWSEFPGLNGSQFEQLYHGAMHDRIAGTVTAFYPDHNRWYEVHSYPAANGIIVYFRNVSEQTLAKAALQQTTAELERQLQKFNALKSAIPDFIYMFDLSGRFIDANKPLLELWQKTQEEAIGKNFFELDYPTDLAIKLQNQVQQVIQTRQPLKDETPYTSAIGTRAYEYIFVPVFDSEGAVEMVAGVTRDITELKQLLESEQATREQAETANRLKDEFLAILSHELRSPLNPILGWCSLLRTGKLNATKTAQAIETIERNAKLQVQLIDDLLDVSRILQGKISFKAVPINLVSIIEAALDTVQLAAQAKSIQIQTLLDSSTGIVLGDSARLQQIVWNLLNNAIKFTPEQGQIIIRLEQINNQAQIQITDTGRGIKSEFLPHVFEYFRQADSSTTRKFGGLGLGLAIVRHLVELHGGTVQAASPGEAQGATFTVRLPLLETKQAPTNQANDFLTPPAETKPLFGIRVLLVDDDADARDLITFTLEDNGAIVTAVASGQEALAAFEQTQLDLLISDIGMPDMDGYMLIKQIRAMAQEELVVAIASRCPFRAIALTAFAGESDQQKAIAAGFNLHISKPVEPLALIEVIQQLLNHETIN